MTRLLSFLIISLTLLYSCKGQSSNQGLRKSNYIDSIQSANQISALLLKIDGRYKEFVINENLKFKENDCQKLNDSLKIQPWVKADFDNNGLTDILVIGNWYDHYVLCILDKGNTYEIKPITRRNFQECTFPVVDNKKIKYYFNSNPDYGKLNKARKLEEKTLIFKFGDFIEENMKSASHEIEKIEYSTTGCYGTCPIFNLSITSDKSANWFADMYNQINDKEIKGRFKTIITQEKFDELINLLNYIDFENLKDNYAVSWTDDQGSTLKITYDHGKIKSITDYGLIGTYGLDRVYQLLFDLRQNQKWER